MEHGEDEFTTGVPFLEARVTIQANGLVYTKHYSKSHEIDNGTPRLPTKGGATPKSVYRQAIASFCRTLYTTSTSIIDYVEEVTDLANPSIHPGYSHQSIAHIAVQTLTLPDSCRYGSILNKHRLEQTLRCRMCISKRLKQNSNGWHEARRSNMIEILKFISPP